ncbi:PadR family transcriptional regulator [Glutamicibacter protophormiae]|uniref:PadR family transcriptional regulator n=1 Tax=Glutamicibacter protophormiae TaxID=37930 RepID=UPI0033289849
MVRPTEEQEWALAKIDSWVETYKKSMLTPVIMMLVATNQPTTVAVVAQLITEKTGWHITERGLYRTIKRLQDSGILQSLDVDAPRTGAKKKELSLTEAGRQLLEGMRANMVESKFSAGDIGIHDEAAERAFGAAGS